MPFIERKRGYDDGKLTRVSTEADYNNPNLILYDSLHIVTAAEEISKTIEVGFHFPDNEHVLEVYVNGQFMRTVVTIDGTDYGDYTELNNHIVVFEDGVISEGDQIRFRLIRKEYDCVRQHQLNLEQLGRDVFGDLYPQEITNGTRSEKPSTPIPNGDTTPDLSNNLIFRTQNTNPTTITNFTGGKLGDTRYIAFGDYLTTVQNSANIQLVGNRDFTSADDGGLLILQYRGSPAHWTEVGRHKVASTTNMGIVERATNAEAEAGSDTERYITPYQLQEYAPEVIGENMIINGRMDFWERGIDNGGWFANNYTWNLSIGSPIKYTADRWRASCENNTTYTGSVSRQTFFGSGLPTPNVPIYYLRWQTTVNTGTPGLRQPTIAQRVEDVTTLENCNTVLSFWAKSPTSTPMEIAVYQNFGSGGSSGVSVLGHYPILLTTSWQKFEVPVTMPTVVGKSVGVASYVEIMFSILFGITGTIDLALVQWKQGKKATDFIARPKGTEQALCERYYQRGHYFESAAPANTLITNEKFVEFRTSMRTSPTVSGNATFATCPTGSNVWYNVVAASRQDGFQISWASCNGADSAPYWNPWVADAEL